MKIGTSTVTAIFLGTTSIVSAYLGSTQVFGGASVFTPLDLFSTGAQGIWLDPSDLTTMFSDRAGTTPVTTPGTVVGLRLDKSKGLVLGPELVANGDFAAGSTGWTATSSGSMTADGSGYRITNTITAASTMSQSFVTVVGRGYSVTLDVLGIGGGASSAQVRAGTTAGAFNTGFAALPIGSNTFYFVANATTTFISVVANSGLIGAYGAYDNISVRELAGNHATAPTDAARPIYGVEPKGGRRNLLTWSEDFGNAVWRLFRGTVSTDVVVAPNGTTSADSFIETATTGAHVIDLASGITITAPTACVTSIYVRKNSTRQYVQVRGAVVSGDAYPWVVVDTQTGSLTQNAAVTSSGCVDVDANWWRVFVGYTTGVTGGAVPVFGGSNSSSAPATTSQYGASYLGDVSSSISLWGVQLELGSTATAYQRVTTAYDITESGVDTCHYVQYDGSDDSMSTAAIDFTATDKMSVFAGVRKLSDSGVRFIVELSAAASAGSFFIAAPGDPMPSYYALGLTGTAYFERKAQNAALAAPVSNVISTLFDLAQTGAGEIVFRANGVVETLAAQSGTNAGTGNFGSYPLFIGRRNNTSFPFSGKDYGLIVVGKAASAGEITDTETWLAAKTAQVTL